MKNLYGFTFSLVIVLFCSSLLYASAPKPIWQTGNVTFWDRSIWTGEVSYNWLAEMVLFRQPDGRVQAFSVNQVSRFGWFDQSKNAYREFVALADSVSNVQTNRSFFEIYVDGPLSVVRQLRPQRGLRKALFSHPKHFVDQPILASNSDFFDYFVYDTGRLRKVDRFYTDIYQPLMMNFDRQIRRYATTHNINDRSLQGRLVLICHYNFLVQQDPRSASVKSTLQETYP